MRAFTKFAATAAMALFTAAALPASAATLIASYDTGTRTTANFKFTNGNAGNTSDDATFFSTATGTANVVGAAPIKFTYFDAGLPAFDGMAALLTISGTVTDTAATTDGTTYTQAGLNGSFNIVFNGTTGVYDGKALVKGSTSLFSGTFTNAWIQGQGGVGGLAVTLANTGSATFNTHSIFDLTDLQPGTEEFTIKLANITPTLGIQAPGAALTTFRAKSGGDFQASFVPEPATWGLMIMGFGGAGAMLRRRRHALAA